MLESLRTDTTRVLSVLIVAALVIPLGATTASAGDMDAPNLVYTKESDLPVRLQWNTNYGYCGEVSFISAGMRLGQYTSQWTARNLASGGVAQWRVESQLLLGAAPHGNAATAAKRMKLQAVSRYTRTLGTPAFLAWVKRQFVAGKTVIIGVYNNVNILGMRQPGDPHYDHIAPIVRISSTRPLDGANAGRYFATDTITLSDSGLFTPRPNTAPNVPGNTRNNPRGSALYTYQFGKFQKSRAQANRGTSAAKLYSLRRSPANFAVAVTGIVDNTPGGPVTVPVRLTSSINNEGFQNQDFMHSAPTGKPMTLTATVAIPNRSKAYKLYRYNSFADVPTANFNARAGQAAQSWTIPARSGSTFTVRIVANTRDTQVFRAVPASAL